MGDQWHDDDDISRPQIKDDDDDAPDDWEAELEEKPKPVEEKSKVSTKAPTTTKNKANKKKFDAAEEEPKIIREPDGDYTPEQMDEIRKKEALNEEHEKINMVTELVETDAEHQSLDNLNLITNDEFLNYSKRLCSHLEIVSKSEFYPEFIDHFLTGITKSMSADNIKRLQSVLQAIYIRKQSEEKEKKAKLKPKKTVKPQLKPVRRNDYGAFADDAANDFDQDPDYDEDDFM